MALKIGKYIEYALDGGALSSAVGGRIYPIIAPITAEPKMPYVVHAMNGLTEMRDKDCVYADSVMVEIVVMARSQEELESIAQLVRNAMGSAWSGWNATDNIPFMVTDQSMSAGQEDYDMNHDGFYITLNYTIETT